MPRKFNTFTFLNKFSGLFCAEATYYPHNIKQQVIKFAMYQNGQPMRYLLPCIYNHSNTYLQRNYKSSFMFQTIDRYNYVFGRRPENNMKDGTNYIVSPIGQYFAVCYSFLLCALLAQTQGTHCIHSSTAFILVQHATLPAKCSKFKFSAK